MMTSDPTVFVGAAPPRPDISTTARHFPVLFLSDLHLGSRACRAEALLDFLQSHTADVIYLVGDIVDTWAGSIVQWPENHHAILRLLLDRARNGTKVIYTPGNHDAFFRQYCGQHLGGVEIVSDIIHLAADGRRYLVTHGDICDVFDARFPAVARLGAKAESLFRGLGAWVNALRRRSGRKDCNLVDRVMRLANDLIRGLDQFEKRLADLARVHGVDGIICGHFHKPALHSDHAVAYANCGDWVENSTALAETASGRLLLLDWADRTQEKKRTAPRLRIGATA